MNKMVIIVIFFLLSIINTGCFSDDIKDEDILDNEGKEEMKNNFLLNISGTVTDKITNAPIVKATVIAYIDVLSKEGFASTKTSSNGTFQIPFPRSKDYHIIDNYIYFNLDVSSDDYILTPFSQRVNSYYGNLGTSFKCEIRQEIRDCNITLYPSGSFKINIKSESTSQPLDKATVLLESVNDPHHIEGINSTDSNGVCTISEIPTGVYNLIVSKVGYITQVVRNVIIEHEKIIEIDVENLTNSQDYVRVYGGNQSQVNNTFYQNRRFIIAYHNDTNSIAAASMFMDYWYYELGLLPGNYIFKACGIGYGTSQKMINITDIDSFENDIYLVFLP